jgi:hypothetical protein
VLFASPTPAGTIHWLVPADALWLWPVANLVSGWPYLAVKDVDGPHWLVRTRAWPYPCGVL